MSSPQRVLGAEGMLLSPQHVQQHAYRKALPRACVDAIAPNGRGVQHLELDPRALASGQLLVRAFGRAPSPSVRDDGRPAEDVPGQSGWYRCSLRVRPHFRHMDADFTLSLVGRLDK